MGVLKPKQGSIRLFGIDSKKFKEWNKVGYVSQKASSFNSGFPATVLRSCQWDLFRKRSFSLFTKDDKEKVEKAIADVGMSEFKGRNIGELSGGQQQRVFIARALVSNPQLLILDEPTVGIDVKNVESFYEILEDLNKRLGITLILVTHDMGAVTEKVTHVACLNQHLHFHGNVEKFRELEDAEMSVLYGHHVHRLEHEHEHHGRI